MWKKGNESKWKGSKKPYKERKDRDKSSIICYKCKKPGHFKSEYPDLEKTYHKKRYFKPKDNKVLMSTWEDQDDTSFDEEIEEEEEKANLFLMANTTSKGSDFESDEYVNINNIETLQSTYHELLSNSSILSKACQNLRKDFKSLSKDYEQLQGKHEENTNNSSKFSTQPCDGFETLKKTTKLHIENEKIYKEKSSLLKDLQKLKNQL
ncbi:hypothetical protein D0Y65_038889 [Glycine soja]|uniref:CCHC-type domain-containing protein n=1 Tax=Glycine soja TaxID=3848 RepID=A0A445H788_GLYSO|nr:hypothetical protein D0Y65_038889 [Glycine soja]